MGYLYIKLNSKMRKHTKLFLFSVFAVLCNISIAQINTEGAFGGTGHDSIVTINPTIDQTGYVVFGASNSFSSSTESFIMRTDQAGNYSWARVISSTNTNFQPIAAIEAHGSTLSNQEYIICFYTNNDNILQLTRYNYTTDTYVSEAYYNVDINYMKAHSFVRTNSGYVLVISSNNGRSHALAFDTNLNLTGNLSEQHSSAHITDVIVDAGRVFIAGTSTDNQYFYIKEVDDNLNSTGIGEKIYGVAFDQGGNARVEEVQIARNAAGEFLIATHSVLAPMNGKVILKTDSNGDNPIAYEYGIQGESDFFITDVASTADGFVLTGYTSSTYVNSQGEEDVVFIKVSDQVDLQKASIFGKEAEDRGQFINANDDGSVTIYAKSSSFSTTGDDDFYVIKTDASASSLCNETVINFTLEEETVLTPGAQTLFDWNMTPFAATKDLEYVTSDATLTALCGCEQVLSFDASAEACTGEPVMLSVPGGNLDYVWDFGGDIIDSSLTDGTLFITYLTPGIKQITLSVANNSCYQSGSASVTVYPTPQISINAPASTCAQSAVDVSCEVSPNEDTLWMYNWNFGSNATPALSSAVNPQGIVYSEGSREDTITLTVNNAHCSNVERHAISILATAIADFSSNAPKCTGEDVEFIYTGNELAAVDLSWYFDGGVNSGTVYEPVVVYNDNNSGERLVTLTASIGSCSTEVSKAITINQSPDAGFSISPASICARNTISFNAPVQPQGTDWVYTWDFGSEATPSISAAQNPEDIQYSSEGTKTISLRVESSYCSDQHEEQLTVLPTPVVSFESTAPACSGDTIQFTFTGNANSGDYSWDFDGAQEIITASDIAPSVLYSRATEGQKNIQLFVNASGCIDSSSMVITIHETPLVDFVSFYDTLCIAERNRFANTGSSGDNWSYTWDFGSGAFPQSAYSENPADIEYQTSGTKYITLIVGDDYCSNSYIDSLYVNALPVVDIIEDITICANERINVGGAEIDNYSYQWYSDGTLNSNTAANPTANPDAAITQYILRVTDNLTNCINSDSVIVTKLDPVTANAGIDVEICRGDSIEIGSGTTEDSNDFMFTWTDTRLDSNYISIGIPDMTVSPDSTTIYRLSVFRMVEKMCGTGVDEVRVIVNQLPDVKAKDYKHNDTTEIAEGESVQLLASGATQYEWSPYIGLNNDGVFDPVADPMETTLYTVLGTDIKGCKNTDSVLVIVNIPEFWAPNAFSPDDDGVNDYFKIEIKGTNSFEFSIYTRSGEQVFATESPELAWDGNKQGTSSPLPQGAYVYVVSGTFTNGEAFAGKGIVNLVR